MVVATADRPPELRDTGAGQATDQIKLYGASVRWFCEVGTAEVADPTYWRSVAARSVAEASGPPAGPVHLNLAFREPLVPGGRRGGRRRPPRGTPVGDDRPRPRPSRRRRVGRAGGGHRGHAQGSAGGGVGLRGVAGRGRALRRRRRLADPGRPHLRACVPAPTPSPPTTPCCGCRRWPTASAPTWSSTSGPPSPARWPPGGSTPTSPASSSTPTGRGSTPTGARRNGWWPTPTPSSPLWPTGWRPTAGSSGSKWLAAWDEAEAIAREAIDACLVHDDVPSEPRAARDLVDCLPDGASLVVGSSMPVRDVEAFARPRRGVRFHSNRGVNGIDGFVSTVLGVAVAAAATTAGPSSGCAATSPSSTTRAGCWRRPAARSTWSSW